MLSSFGLKQNVAVKFMAWYCLIGFIVVQVLYLAVWCRPIQQYWAVPVVNRKLRMLHATLHSADTNDRTVCDLLQPYDHCYGV